MTTTSKMRPLKITTVGDPCTGKTCMLITYATKQFPIDYIPTVFDNYADIITINEISYNLTLWDTAGQEDYDRLRPLSYPNTDCFIVCYSIDNRKSYDNIISKWIPELKHFSPKVPIILVATKSDLRNDASTKLLSFGEGKRLMKRIKASALVECSALKKEGLREVFEEAIRAVTLPTKSTTCIVL